MKAKIYLILFLLVAAEGYSNQIPKPSVLFNFTEMILNQAQQILFAVAEKPVRPTKVKPMIKAKGKAPVTVPVDIVPPGKPESEVEVPKIKRDGMWIVSEEEKK